MKNLRSNIARTGVVETLANLQKYNNTAEIMEKAAIYIPVPEKQHICDPQTIADSLTDLGKSRLLFLTPEIAVIEKLAQCENPPQIVVCLSSAFDGDTCSSIAANMPQGLQVDFISENEILDDFMPAEAAIVAFGFFDGHRGLILGSNYRMMERYKAFSGSKEVQE